MSANTPPFSQPMQHNFHLRACLKIAWDGCFSGSGVMARRDEGEYPSWVFNWGATESKRRERKTLRAAGLLPVGGVGSVLTARCGDGLPKPATIWFPKY